MRIDKITQGELQKMRDKEDERLFEECDDCSGHEKHDEYDEDMVMEMYFLKRQEKKNGKV